MVRIPIMLLLASALSAVGPLQAVRERFGDFTYDASTYVVDSGDGAYLVRTRRDRGDDQKMIATVHDAPASDCSIAKLEAQVRDRSGDHSEHTIRTISRDGFDIHIVSWYWGCRNARPPSFAACTAYRGRVYRFLALSIGCKGGPGFGPRPEGFLGSLAAVP